MRVPGQRLAREPPAPASAARYLRAPPWGCKRASPLQARFRAPESHWSEILTVPVLLPVCSANASQAAAGAAARAGKLAG
jgi:hypothetical protein